MDESTTYDHEAADADHRLLQSCVDALTVHHLLAKHAHWNLSGPGFNVVHQLLDRVHDDATGLVDVLAERIAVTGGSPSAWPAVDGEWFSLGRDGVEEHLTRVTAHMSEVIALLDRAQRAFEHDYVTQDALVNASATLQFNRWLLSSESASARQRSSS